ncbi:hypothetical protein [Nocardioides alcanivorans]|uniref:hypothetical protein n=1 Tax=Nocardioides alcanivorans TaxID=2897352 RepID=UPI001F3ECED6|nr:hypothetical protein [Nocardioides alcanivorans]
MDPYSLRAVVEGSAEFVTQVSEACLAVGIRRDESDFENDLTVGLNVLAKIKTGDDLTDGDLDTLAPAYERIVSEWEQTVVDLEAVDAAPPLQDEWDDVLAAARERIDVYGNRLEAVRSGDLDRVTEAMQPTWEYPGIPIQDAGVQRPVCMLVSG